VTSCRKFLGACPGEFPAVAWATSRGPSAQAASGFVVPLPSINTHRGAGGGGACARPQPLPSAASPARPAQSRPDPIRYGGEGYHDFRPGALIVLPDLIRYGEGLYSDIEARKEFLPRLPARVADCPPGP